MCILCEQETVETLYQKKQWLNIWGEDFIRRLHWYLGILKKKTTMFLYSMILASHY